ncbi:hypothetical protein PHACT_13675 [Pseudohongiella acticola]|jgi:hypothetical protein|uniref:Uncharacterized protein n=1 Tax=Pseudohongiella acticola TaxID=1524254 RepID=A0A1E8CGJ0_9GAMM|nr:hypothetical protein [Pseudohongiella acticola]OFE11584.1 hypothetical protein PHACT_13675 [Pseudohongiella acticola]
MKFDDMLLDPANAFDSPDQVLETGSLSREQKIRILRRWDDDARLLLTAQSEGMQSADSGSDVLKQVQSALEKLGAAASDT